MAGQSCDCLGTRRPCRRVVTEYHLVLAAAHGALESRLDLSGAVRGLLVVILRTNAHAMEAVGAEDGGTGGLCAGTGEGNLRVGSGERLAANETVLRHEGSSRWVVVGSGRGVLEDASATAESREPGFLSPAGWQWVRGDPSW